MEAEKLSRLNYKLRDPIPGRISGLIHVAELKQYFRTEDTADATTSSAQDHELDGGAEGSLPTHRCNTRNRRVR